MQHLLSAQTLSVEQIQNLLDRAAVFAKNPPPQELKKILFGKTIVNIFFEDSTRTRTSFEMAAKKLGADVINIAVEHSSLNKGETLLDTALNLQAIGASAIVIRHPGSMAPHQLAEQLKIPVINAGDGSNEHPTQALLDAFTIIQKKKKLAGLVVAICGDLAHSRVARSNIALLKKMGAAVRVIAPATLMPDNYFTGQVEYFTDLRKAVAGVDVVMALRIQKERMQQGEIPNDREYFFHYGLDHEKMKLAKPDAIVMHPGPMNRGVEIDSTLADDPRCSVILDQVQNGVYMRMAVLQQLLAA